MSLIYVLCPPQAYEAAKSTGIYCPDSLESEGFIHASPANQLTRVANKYYSAYPKLCLMAIDTEAATVEIKWEPIANGDLYPHLYGPLNMSAVTQTSILSRLPDGRYEIELPEAV